MRQKVVREFSSKKDAYIVSILNKGAIPYSDFPGEFCKLRCRCLKIIGPPIHDLFKSFTLQHRWSSNYKMEFLEPFFKKGKLFEKHTR